MLISCNDKQQAKKEVHYYPEIKLHYFHDTVNSLIYLYPNPESCYVSKVYWLGDVKIQNTAIDDCEFFYID